MSKNINQIFTANPITSNTSTDLMYFGQSPYGSTNDAAMTYSNFSSQFTKITTPVIVSGTSQAMLPNNFYIITNDLTCTLSLPATSRVGDIIEVLVTGDGISGSFIISQGTGQTISFGFVTSTAGTGGNYTTVADGNAYDYVKLICTTANTAWVVIGAVGQAAVN